MDTYNTFDFPMEIQSSTYFYKRVVQLLVEVGSVTVFLCLCAQRRLRRDCKLTKFRKWEEDVLASRTFYPGIIGQKGLDVLYIWLTACMGRSSEFPKSRTLEAMKKVNKQCLLDTPAQ